MGNLELTSEEEKELFSFIERYYHDLRVEIANTDDREFRRSLKHKAVSYTHLTLPTTPYV